MYRKLLSASAIALLASACTLSTGVYDLACEGLDEPLGIDSANPHFSWKIESSAAAQAAYEIEVASSPKSLRSGDADLWATGKVESSGQVMVPYQGKPLSSRQLYWWRVRVWDSDGKASGWSPVRRFGIGIIDGDYLRGDYIGAVPGEGRSPILRKAFKAGRIKGSALLYVNSLGYHEAYINGRKVSEAVLQPAVSQLDKRSLTAVYDVTPLLRNGDNEIVLWTGSGWYKSATFGAVYGGPLVKAELVDVTSGDAVSVVSTDASWEGTWSGYKDYGTWTAWHFGGEIIDSRTVPAKMDRKTLDAMEWGPVDVVSPEGIKEVQMMCEPCVVQETLEAQSIESLGDGKWAVDFGRVVNGMLEIRLPMLPEGTVSHASFADNREKDGSFSPVSRDDYISSGAASGDRFTNKFNHHVFRYVILDSLENAPSLKDIKALRMRTDYKKTASFESSDKELNAIHDMVAYTLENLAFDGYMVDCANIERLGYGGDGNASTLTLQIMYGVAPLYLNWIQAWGDVIREDGGLPHTAPCPERAGGGPYWCGFIVQAPWRTYMSYGDTRPLERLYPAMNHWLEYVDAYTVDGLLGPWPNTDYRHWYLGDWAAPDGVNVSDPESVGLVNNCSLCQVYSDLAGIALLLGKDSEAAAFTARLDALKARINERFFHPDTFIYGSGSQIDMAYPLLVGAVPEEYRDSVRNRLFERTETVYDKHLKTGLVGIPVITEWATLAGECDWMYGMLKQHGYPGYLHMLDHGATGTWEHWNARRSRLHNCFNGIGSWFYQALGGIIPDAPAYRHIVLNPQIPEGLESVKVSQETPYGTIKVERNGKELHFEIPVGVTATFNGKEYSAGKYDVTM